MSLRRYNPICLLRCAGLPGSIGLVDRTTNLTPLQSSFIERFTPPGNISPESILVNQLVNPNSSAVNRRMESRRLTQMHECAMLVEDL